MNLRALLKALIPSKRDIKFVGQVSLLCIAMMVIALPVILTVGTAFLGIVYLISFFLGSYVTNVFVYVLGISWFLWIMFGDTVMDRYQNNLQKIKDK